MYPQDGVSLHSYVRFLWLLHRFPSAVDAMSFVIDQFRISFLVELMAFSTYPDLLRFPQLQPSTPSAGGESPFPATLHIGRP